MSTHVSWGAMWEEIWPVSYIWMWSLLRRLAYAYFDRARFRLHTYHISWLLVYRLLHLAEKFEENGAVMFVQSRRYSPPELAKWWEWPVYRVLLGLGACPFPPLPCRIHRNARMYVGGATAKLSGAFSGMVCKSVLGNYTLKKKESFCLDSLYTVHNLHLVPICT